MARKDKKEPKTELDTKTTVADMNVEGLPWYDPARKEGKQVPQLTKKEKRAMLWGAYKAYLPMIGCIAVVFIAMFLLVYLWLK